MQGRKSKKKILPLKIDNRKLAIAMAERELSGVALARLAGVSPAALSAVRRYRGGTKEVTVGRLAKALGLSVRELLVDDIATSEAL